MRHGFVIALLLLLLIACSTSTCFDKSEQIPNRSWEYENVLTFDINTIEPEVQYDMYINLRHSKKYNYSNIFLKVHESQEGFIDTTQRIEIRLAELDGKWIGNSAGDLYTHQYLYKENISFRDTSLYKIEIEQNMRQNPLMHITDVGIRLVKK